MNLQHEKDRAIGAIEAAHDRAIETRRALAGAIETGSVATPAGARLAVIEIAREFVADLQQMLDAPDIGFVYDRDQEFGTIVDALDCWEYWTTDENPEADRADMAAYERGQVVEALRLYSNS